MYSFDILANIINKVHIKMYRNLYTLDVFFPTVKYVSDDNDWKNVFIIYWWGDPWLDQKQFSALRVLVSEILNFPP